MALKSQKVEITKEQAEIHKAGEGLGLVAGPILLVIATNKKLSTGSRVALGAIGLGTIAFDAYLLSKWK